MVRLSQDRAPRAEHPTLGSSQQVFGTSDQITRAERLGEKRLDVESGSLFSNRSLVARREHYHVNRVAPFLRANVAERFHAVHVWHRIIEQDEFRTVGFEKLQRFGAASHAVDRRGYGLESKLQQPEHVLLIIDKQDLVVQLACRSNCFE